MFDNDTDTITLDNYRTKLILTAVSFDPLIRLFIRTSNQVARSYPPIYLNLFYQQRAAYLVINVCFGFYPFQLKSKMRKIAQLERKTQKKQTLLNGWPRFAYKNLCSNKNQRVVFFILHFFLLLMRFSIVDFHFRMVEHVSMFVCATTWLQKVCFMSLPPRDSEALKGMEEWKGRKKYRICIRRYQRRMSHRSWRSKD